MVRLYNNDKGKMFDWGNLGFRSEMSKGNTWRFKLYHDYLE